MTNKTIFAGYASPHFRVYILSQAVKHKSFPFDKYKRKYSEVEFAEHMIFLGEYDKNVA